MGCRGSKGDAYAEQLEVCVAAPLAQQLAPPPSVAPPEGGPTPSCSSAAVPRQADDEDDDDGGVEYAGGCIGMACGADTAEVARQQSSFAPCSSWSPTRPADTGAATGPYAADAPSTASTTCSFEDIAPCRDTPDEDDWIAQTKAWVTQLKHKQQTSSDEPWIVETKAWVSKIKERKSMIARQHAPDPTAAGGYGDMKHPAVAASPASLLLGRCCCSTASRPEPQQIQSHTQLHV